MGPHVAGVSSHVGGASTGDGIDDGSHPTVEAVAGGVGAGKAPVREAQQPREVVGVPPAIGVRLAEPDAALAQDAGVRALITDANGEVDGSRALGTAAAPEAG